MGFLDKLRAAMARFMSGRYGADQLSMAMVIAALCAEGTTTIEDAHYIERGYEDIVGKLRAVGADISMVDEPETEKEEARIG